MSSKNLINDYNPGEPVRNPAEDTAEHTPIAPDKETPNLKQGKSVAKVTTTG